MQEEDKTLRAVLEEQTAMTPEQFLLLARGIASGVEHLHRKHILHLDLRPERIRVGSDGNEAELIDSGREVRCSSEGYARPPSNGSFHAGLPYCSPENTGRMQRTIDERSDLYSLGVIFYEMLTGRLPFLADNPLEWIYMHLAQSPPPMTSGDVRLPDGLEAIVMKLLDKNPDHRYPNAGLLIANLDKIGRSDDTFFAAPGFYGREQEMAILTEAFYSACLGSTEVIYVSGEAGFGKTSLMDEMFRKQPHDRDFYYITGKFEQIPQLSPYPPIIQAFRGLMRHLLGERKHRSDLLKQKLQTALGANTGLITAMIPEAGLLLGAPSSAEETELPSNESKTRFIYAFRKFAQALASKDHPVVLFIDDLQWADASSLELMRALLSDPESQYFMFVCAYRPSETDRGRLPGYETDGSISEQAAIRHLPLSPLSLEQMNRIVMETLNSPADVTMSLTELLYPQSGGNPFHFKQILLRLQDDRSLLYNREKQMWQWNLGLIIERLPGYAIHELIEHRLRRLPPDAQALLQAAACAGSAFDPRLIASVTNRAREDAVPQWAAMEAEGIIVPGDHGKLRFAHDSIQRLIYQLIDEESKQDIHLRIGRGLEAAEEGNDESPFDGVNHLNKGSARITAKRDLRLLAAKNLDAGNRAKATSAYDVALGYFGKGVELLSEEDWNEDFELIFELHAQKAECEFLCGNHEQYERDIGFALERARNPVERSRVQTIRIMQLINQGKYSEGTALGLKCLSELHIIISPEPGKFSLLMEGIRIETLLRNRYDRLPHMKEMSDKRRMTAMNLIFAIIPSTFFTNKKIFFLLVCRAIQLSLRYGNTPVSAAVYSAYGMLLAIGRGKFDRGYAIGKVGVELSERYQVASITSKTYTIFGGVLCQFAGSAREGDAYLAKALRSGMDSGDYVFASYAMGAHVNSLYTRASLSELARTIADYMSVLDTTKDEFVRQNFYLYQQVILALQEKTEAPDSFNGSDFDEEAFLERIRQEETSATTLFQYSTYKTQLSYFLGDFEEAARWARQAEAYEDFATHLPHLPECLFYETLAAAQIHARSQQNPLTEKRLSRALRRFGKWTRWSTDNFRSRRLLLEAELARATWKLDSAEEGYDKAIREAREQGDFRVIGLAGELAANYYDGCGKRTTALHYLQLAVEGYKQWEVPLKIRQTEERLQDLLRRESAASATEYDDAAPAGQHDVIDYIAASSSLPSEPYSLDGVDLTAILTTTQTIANRMDMDTVLAEIMGTILKHAGAGKGALITGSQETLYIQAYADSDAGAPSLPLELLDSSLVPEGLVRYVFRTRENVRYSGDEESWLIHNPYIGKHRPQSALCVPITVHGSMLGVLYLENRLTGGVFAADRLAVLLAMASQGIMLCALLSSSDPAYVESETEENLPSAHELMEEPLTERELEVLALLAAGLSNKEIADHLIIAVGTVKVHVKNIFAKLKVNRRIKAIEQAKELRLLDR
ncbi:PAS sensor protein [Cohnella sp. CIP 111063]|uniref:helix-turn-helix transcriptional regulator n=1 Tax=unclassified Cohnella TaxID=2636738 RepID=UPI000B8C60F8|nr:MULTISPECIES: AAA family ATPase [unclassified Cohnella]OXS59292.1 PAS sensor protein [Cohnella sp. CIP 111063]PRX72316.1 putative ATPase [Cohnella sp. SGD-V74]